MQILVVVPSSCGHVGEFKILPVPVVTLVLGATLDSAYCLMRLLYILKWLHCLCVIFVIYLLFLCILLVSTYMELVCLYISTTTIQVLVILILTYSEVRMLCCFYSKL